MGGVIDYIGVKNILYVVLQIGEKSFSSVIFEAKGIKKIKIKNQFQPKTNTRFIWLVLTASLCCLYLV